MISFERNDGGRKAAGYKGSAGDCVPRSIIIALGLDYKTVRGELDALCSEMTGGFRRSTRDGTPVPVGYRYLSDRGWVAVPCTNLYVEDMPETGTYILVSKKHWIALVDGVIHDTWDSRSSRRTRNGSTKLLGYFEPGA